MQKTASNSKTEETKRRGWNYYNFKCSEEAPGRAEAQTSEEGLCLAVAGISEECALWRLP